MINHEMAVHLSESAIGDVLPAESQQEIREIREPAADSGAEKRIETEVTFKSSGRLLVALSSN